MNEKVKVPLAMVINVEYEYDRVNADQPHKYEFMGFTARGVTERDAQHNLEIAINDRFMSSRRPCPACHHLTCIPSCKGNI